jgi:hypothetical protein
MLLLKSKALFCILYYKHVTIVNNDSSIINKWCHSLERHLLTTLESSYVYNTEQATGECMYLLALNWKFKSEKPYFLAEPDRVKFWFSQTHFSNAQIIFPASFPRQGDSIRMLQWLYGARTLAKYLIICIWWTQNQTFCVLVYSPCFQLSVPWYVLCVYECTLIETVS